MLITLNYTTIIIRFSCKNYPSEFILDKDLAKEYFRQFGKMKRMVFRPKQRICTVEYVNKESFIKALNNAGEYQGQLFKVHAEKSPEVKKKKVGEKRPRYIDNDEIKAELEAMGGIAPKTHNLPEGKILLQLGQPHRIYFYLT